MTAAKQFTVSVPCSTANLGPGFDTLGCGLSLRMSVTCTFPDVGSGVTVSYSGDSPHTVPLDPARNLVSRTAIETAASFGQLLPTMHIAIENPIPLGRGLGSSGTAVVAGVVLANEALGLGMDTQRILDYCLSIEGHPDNITASILGGFVASYKREHPDPAPARVESAAYKQSYAKLYPSLVPAFEAPPLNLGRHLRLKVSPKIKFVVTIPEFELQTKLARSVLPQDYPKADVIYNLQRLAVLVATLTSADASLIDPAVISEAMHDRVHQKYRQHLVPGLPEILSLSYKNLPGLLGVCVSGAGPTVLCLATDNFEQIGNAVVDIFGKHTVDEAPGYEGSRESKKTKVGIKASFKVLEVSTDGFLVTRK
ncbi:ribosomal protein S5 domain 2-type protein [Obelidium mucronatum]|nr:ribosomal protein S5 domain 2-type protein [Obelidium mucronatum]